jgi:hypothetical protein
MVVALLGFVGVCGHVFFGIVNVHNHYSSYLYWYSSHGLLGVCGSILLNFIDIIIVAFLGSICVHDCCSLGVY